MAAGTCVARVLGAEMTGDPAMLASGCEEDIEVMPRRETGGGLINHLGNRVIFTSQSQIRALTLIAAKEMVRFQQLFLQPDHFLCCK